VKKKNNMKKMLVLRTIVLIYSLTIINLHAALADSIAVTPVKQLADTCAACHGPQGQSIIPTNPNLAGQNEKYFIDQVLAFKQGQTGPRNNPIMQALVAPLTDDQIKTLANYFSEQKMNVGSTAEKYVTLGKLIYQGGIREKNIPACSACHGPAGLGNPSAGFPLLSGQHANYVIAQLEAYQNGTRSNDINGMMTTLSKRLNKNEIEAVANYIQGLH
jgi:cytochrome c553